MNVAEQLATSRYFFAHPANPILTGKDWPYSINSVFNAGATLLADGTTLLLCRVEDRRGLVASLRRALAKRRGRMAN